MKKIIEFLKENIKLVTIALFVIILLAIGFIYVIKNVTSDGMNNKGIYKISYRTYTDKWSSYQKNGNTSGNTKDKINDIEIKIKNNKKGGIYYSVYTDDWSPQIFDYNKVGKDIKGIKIGLTGSLYKKYSVCYRTYNKKDKWLNWTCDSSISGNEEEPITAIEIKIIPKKSVKFDYLKDYNKVSISSKNF